MVDTRFHRFSGPATIGAILAAIDCSEHLAESSDQAFLVQGVAELELAGPGDLALAANPAYAEQLRATKAGLVIIAPALRDAVPAHTQVIVLDHPHRLFVEILDFLYPDSTRSIIAAARDDMAEPLLEADVVLGANVVVGNGAEIGRGSVIGANSVIGAGVAIGRNCIIAANTTINCAYIGNDVTVHSGARIGAEGFGWLDHGQSNRKIPQLGRVIVQDRVEIGANTTIDRGALGDTVIGEGTKIDNLVQIGHNCRIGRNCLIAAMSGLSGSSIIGDGVLMGGGSGTSGHMSVGAGSVVHGRAAVTKDWPPGSKLAGAPAQDIRDFWREIAAMRRLSKGDKR